MMHFVEHGVQPIEIDLKTNVVDIVIFFMSSPRDSSRKWNYSDEIYKGGPILSVIQDACLTLLVGHQVLLQKSNSLVRGVSSPLPLANIAQRSLQETTVPANNLRIGIAGKRTEGR
jgi:hypothetical protein